MITPRLVVDLWRAPELSRRHHQGRIQQPSLGEIAQQRRQAPVSRGQQVLLVLHEVLRVAVPVLTLLAKVEHVDERDPRFDQSAGHQQILPPHVPGVPLLGPVRPPLGRVAVDSVPLADRHWFTRDIERLADRFRLQQVAGAIVELPEPPGQLGGGPPPQQGQPLANAGARQLFTQQQFGDGITLPVGIDGDSERVVRPSQEATPLAGDGNHILKHERQARVRDHRPPGSPQCRQR